MEILAIIQARTGSSRLPGKVLLDLCGKPVLERVIERVRRGRLVDQTLVATTRKPQDQALVQVCETLGVPVYLGSEDDVLDRYYQAAQAYQPRHVVRITADCPVLDPVIMDQVIQAHLDLGTEYTNNDVPPTFPNGLDVEVLTFAALERAWREARLPSEREHLTQYLRKPENGFRTHTVLHPENLSGKRWTLDEDRDYLLIREFYERLQAQNPYFGMQEILALLRAYPELEALNQGISRDEGLRKSLALDPKPF